MALSGRLRSALPFVHQILRADGGFGNPNIAATSECLRNFATQAKSNEANVKPLPTEEEKELKQVLQEILGQGKTVIIEQKIDPGILGGLVVEFGQKVFDMSIKTRAKQMEKFLREPINFGSLR